MSRVVFHEATVRGHRADGDTALEKTVIGHEQGCEVLEQRVIRFSPGRSLERGDDERDEILYVASGSGSLELDGARHRLDADTGVYVRAGERYVVENEGPAE